ncbi:MAG TPA: LuxR C-terminal-related transcriptional regulator [Devosia sp.]|uniref:LuxR C-terminal-related transcriptional regulator n=1 Tax=Devosia sp. TaxID=1871048 RepID=UPI002DDD0D3C|nr:LuxR C-terminal-related transcriptional regulator [Devosia sp.]HEV2515698.1 LuxR C-terminal-related transcriptional regulator [Devosia sp.]
MERSRLRKMLDRAWDTRLTILSAPAGFGKTTLLAEWLARSSRTGRAVAWLSLDQTDNEATSFWAHLVAAIRKAVPAVGNAALQVLESGQQPDDDILVELLNELGLSEQEFYIVLDDYHVIDLPVVHATMAFFVEHLPPNLHLVISTRADPALPLPRLRARGELCEIRSADLRFTDEEISAYLLGAVDTALTERDIAVLGDRTEGWIAALQLTALSMKGRTDVAAFIASFEGSDRYIVDYLVEEVLQRQSTETRTFLLQTCFLERLCGSLCRTVTGSRAAGEMLRSLDRSNLFLVPLDDRREWYRYHHLFADVLLTHFSDELQELLPGLHRRASAWFEQNGDRREAIRHALAGGDFESAAGLIELAIPELRMHRQDAAMAKMILALPVDLVKRRPVLSVGLAGALVSVGGFGEVDALLRDAEHCLTAGQGSVGSAIFTDRDQFEQLPGAIALFRSALAQMRGDMDVVIAQSQRVLAVAPSEDHLTRAGASGFLGIAFWTRGDLASSIRAWSHCLAGLRRVGHVADVLASSVAPVDICIAQGRLDEAFRLCGAALDLVVDGTPVTRGIADVHVALAELHGLRGDLASARRHLLASEDFGERGATPRYPARFRIAKAQLARAEGDGQGAIALLAEAERVYVADFYPDVRPISAMIARAAIMQGQLAEASHWVAAAGISADDELSYLREFQHITLARLMLAEGKTGSATIDFLDRLLQAAESGGRIGSVIELLMLRALACQGTGDMAGAIATLGRALALTEPQGYARVFIDEGEAMATLLKSAIKHRIAPQYARRLLKALGPRELEPTTHPDLLEPLSERELDVLRLFRGDLGGPEIARELGISLNTLRTHTKNLFEKLDVNNRRAAVRRAEELGLQRR